MVFTMALSFSCEDSTKELSEIIKDRQEALGTAANIRMVYTDSTIIQAILTAP